jgi:hypothetical protein
MSIDNDDRAEFASDAVIAYKDSKGTDEYEGEEEQTVLGDMLADLQHWADQYGVDFQQAIENGQTHYEAEILEDSKPRTSLPD